ncbi:MAG TPA: phosphoribosyltransferase family protein [Syntrophales bacterium]|nr:phosphoribosyltransferase family protein [Syntrophales bacterium]
MKARLPQNVIEMAELRDRVDLFRDREHAGETLAAMLNRYEGSRAILFAIPAGGVPVAAVMAERLRLRLEVAVVSKITMPWNTEAGYGAVAFDGSVLFNEGILARIGLTDVQIEEGRRATLEKVQRRLRKFRGDRPLPGLETTTAILVDDGLASGFTMLAAIGALRRLGGRDVVVAVPTASASAVERVAPAVESLYCANIRGGVSFAVASAYERWEDVEEQDAVSLFRRIASSAPGS